MNLKILEVDNFKLANCSNEYSLHCSALEWSLAEPIIINSPEDIRSRAEWKDRFSPFQHQIQNLIRFCRRLPVTLLADDVGLGKTISAGLIVCELMKRCKVSKTLIICPKIMIPQWIEELKSKFGMSASSVTGSQIVNISKVPEDAIVTTYHSATRFLDKKKIGIFDMLILDEAHKVRNLHGAQKTPKMASSIFEALEARLFKYVLMLTATPIQNRLWDIYSLIDCLAVARGHKNPLGNPDQFNFKYIADGKVSARKLKKEKTHEFRKIVGSYMFRTRRIDARLPFPERQVQTCSVQPGTDEILLQNLTADNISCFNGLLQTNLLVALMSSPHALCEQIRNMHANGNATHHFKNEISEITEQINIPAKTQFVLELARNLGRENPCWRMVIFTTRKKTQYLLGQVLREEGVKCGFIAGNSPSQNSKTIDLFRKTPPGINVIISTDAGAEGINLQSSNIVVNYDLPWNPMIVEQRIGRVQRIGSGHKNVCVFNIVHQNSPEEKIVARLMEKLQIISHTVGDIEAVLEAAGDNDGGSLEKQIRKMVVASLQGQDTEKVARKTERSIRDAKRMIEEHQKEMDHALGKMKDEEIDVEMPNLERSIPSLSLKDFVIEGMKADDAVISCSDDGLYNADSEKTGKQVFTFDKNVYQRYSQPGYFLGKTPVLYMQGSPPFERFVQKWIDKSSALIDDRQLNSTHIRKLFENWGRGFSHHFQLIEKEIIGGTFQAKGEVLCRVSIANAVDSYEKLLPVTFHAQKELSKAFTHVDHDDLSRILFPELHEDIMRAVRLDNEINTFRRFYEKRLQHELKRSDSGEREKRLRNDLEPAATVEVSALKSNMYSTLEVEIEYMLDEYEHNFSIITIDDCRIAKEPERQKCAITLQAYPIDCLRKCEISGEYALKDKLVTSEISGKVCLPSLLVRCQETGKCVLQEETDVCSISEKRVCSDLLEDSQISNRRALKDYLYCCEITGTKLLEDEICRSDVSGRIFRHDQSVFVANRKLNAHLSEVCKCEFSDDWILEEDSAVSDASHKAMKKDRIVTSDISGRICDISEIQKCDLSGASLLPDEVEKCSITEKIVHKDLLVQCPESGQYALESYFEKCEQTGDKVLPEALGKCIVTGKRVRKSLLAKSEVSGKECLKGSMANCDYSGVNLLPNEKETCEVTGMQVDPRLLKTCDLTKSRVLSQALGRCHLSNKNVRSDHLVKCPETGHDALEKYFERCEQTGDKVLPEALEKCNVTEKQVRKSLLAKSEVSGKECLKSSMAKCEYSGVNLLPNEVGICQITGKRVDARLLKTCEVSQHCVLPESLGNCTISGKKVRNDLLIQCPETGKHALESYFEECEQTGDKVLPEALEKCSVTGKRVRQSLLVKSELSGKKCVQSKIITCANSGLYLLPDETKYCQITQQQVDIRLLRKCSISGVIGLKDKLLKSSYSGKWILPKYAEVFKNGKVFCKNEIVHCNWTGKYFPIDRTAVCSLTGLTFAKKLLNASSEFNLLRNCLDGTEKGSLFPDAMYLARTHPELFKGLKIVHWVTSKCSLTHVLFGKKPGFHFRPLFFALLARGDLTNLTISSKILIGYRKNDVWHLKESYIIEQ